MAVSGFRVFGYAHGELPGKVTGLEVKRNKSDEREASVKWNPKEDVQGYVLRYGIHPDKLYQSVMLYDQNDIALKCLNESSDYIFTVEAFNESGIGPASDVKEGNMIGIE